KLFDAKTEKKGVTAAGDAIDANALGISGSKKYVTGISVKEYKVDGKVSSDKVVLNDGSDDYIVSKSDFTLKSGTTTGEVEFTGSKTTKFTADAGKDVKVLNVKDDALATLDNA
ncbi:TPA: flagellin FliC, partial [Proteus mirabilis]